MVKQKGFSVLESILGLGIITLVLMSAINFFTATAKQKIDQNIADHILILGKAVEEYVKSEYNTDVTGFGKSVSSNGTLDLQTLINAELLPDGFLNNPTGEPYTLTWRREGSFPGYVIRAMIETKVDNELQARNVASYLGHRGGFYDNTQAKGVSGNFSYTNSAFNNISTANNADDKRSVYYLAEYSHAENGKRYRVCFVQGGQTINLNNITIIDIKMVGGGGGGGGAQHFRAPLYKRTLSEIARTCSVNVNTQQWDCTGGRDYQEAIGELQHLEDSDGYSGWTAPVYFQAEQNYYGQKGAEAAAPLNPISSGYVHVSGTTTITVGRGGIGGSNGNPATNGESGTPSTVNYNGITHSSLAGNGGTANGALSAQSAGTGYSINETECSALATNFGAGGRGGASIYNPNTNYAGGGGSSGAVFLEYIQW